MTPRTIEELDALADVDPEIDAIVKSGKMPLPAFDFSDSTKAVLAMRSLMTQYDVVNEISEVDFTKINYTTRDGHHNRLLVFKPASIVKGQHLPLIIHIHGGGGSIGTPEATASFCQALTLKQQCVVVSISYRLAPEHPFPTGINDCIDAVKYLAANAREVGADPALGFVLGGHSYGARAASIISLHAQELGLDAVITGLYFGAGGFVPEAKVPTGYADHYRSKFDERCRNALVLNSQTHKMFLDVYAADKDSPWFQTLNVESLDAVKGQPRAYFQVCGMDILRDDSLIYEDILRKSGTGTRLDIYPGTPHVFWSFLQPGMIRQATKWAEDTQEGFAWLLER
ncbi:hypothetical protein H2198_009437 [Neophaeococcomyces mojaviensis]|uniref:Uncharacterized protein n=1 Tax=Neophaeococcomyces mojaviensis TaxID=3383035 RepID=A0ACC2ZUH0_9EURO|nr:hypothetical protein H2198_009437 [Knufia sp. JES_112]